MFFYIRLGNKVIQLFASDKFCRLHFQIRYCQLFTGQYIVKVIVANAEKFEITWHVSDRTALNVYTFETERNSSNLKEQTMYFIIINEM